MLLAAAITFPGLFMQTPFRQLIILAFLILFALLSSCYRHAGKPYQADDETWYQLALQACQRGDLRAYQALIARANTDVRPAECEQLLVDGDRAGPPLEDTTSEGGR